MLVIAFSDKFGSLKCEVSDTKIYKLFPWEFKSRTEMIVLERSRQNNNKCEGVLKRDRI